MCLGNDHDDKDESAVNRFNKSDQQAKPNLSRSRPLFFRGKIVSGPQSVGRQTSSISAVNLRFRSGADIGDIIIPSMAEQPKTAWLTIAANPLKRSIFSFGNKKPPLRLPQGGFLSESAGCAAHYFQTCHVLVNMYFTGFHGIASSQSIVIRILGSLGSILIELNERSFIFNMIAPCFRSSLFWR